MIRVLIADDQAMVREGFAMIPDAQPDMEVVAQAGDGAQAVTLVRRHRSDVVYRRPDPAPPISRRPDADGPGAVDDDLARRDDRSRRPHRGGAGHARRPAAHPLLASIEGG